jgi:hypothetical protein
MSKKAVKHHHKAAGHHEFAARHHTTEDVRDETVR